MWGWYISGFIKRERGGGGDKINGEGAQGERPYGLMTGTGACPYGGENSEFGDAMSWDGDFIIDANI